MTTPGGLKPCRDHDDLDVVGNRAAWMVLCRACLSVWRDTDRDAPAWVVTFADHWFQGLADLRAAQRGRGDR